MKIVLFLMILTACSSYDQDLKRKERAIELCKVKEIKDKNNCITITEAQLVLGVEK